jgi:branched-chain amino acid transport system substrate-binding protein
VALAAALSGCGSDSGSVEGPVTVYVSLPLSGPRADDGKDAADGARLALEQADSKAGDLDVAAEYLNDARDGGPWDPVVVGENARTAAQDSSAAAYIGELDSQPTRASLPITNEAGIVQISPGAGGVDLTRAAEGYPNSPETYQPSGDPSFARVIPDDATLARGAATLAADENFSPIAEIGPPGGPYEELVLDEFRREAEAEGVEVLGKTEGIPTAHVSVNEGSVVSGHASDGEQFTSRLPAGAIELSSLDPLRASAVVASLAAVSLPSQGFASEFEATFGRTPGPLAAYGYEAMQLALGAIESASDSGEEFRSDVREAVFDAKRPDSVLGTYEITDEGDSTLCAVQPYELTAGEPVPGKPICPPR